MTKSQRRKIESITSQIIDKQMEIQEIFATDCYLQGNPRIEELEKEIRELHEQTQIISSEWDV